MAEIVVSQRVYTTKGNVLPTVIEMLNEGGWANVSSNAATDNYVMYSKGTSGKDALYMHIRPFYNTDAAATNCVTGTGMGGTFRALKSYTPGTTGTAGTFDRTADIYYILNLFGAAGIAANTPECEVSGYVDKDRCLFVVRNNQSAADHSPIVFGFGIPESKYRQPIAGNRDIIFFSSHIMTNIATPAAITANSLVALDYPTGYSDSNAPLLMNVSINNVFKNPTVNNNYVLSPFVFGSASTGPLGELWGVLGIYNVTPAILDKDIIVCDGKKYEVLVSTNTNATALPTKTMAIRIE